MRIYNIFQKRIWRSWSNFFHRPLDKSISKIKKNCIQGEWNWLWRWWQIKNSSLRKRWSQEGKSWEIFWKHNRNPPHFKNSKKKNKWNIKRILINYGTAVRMWWRRQSKGITGPASRKTVPRVWFESWQFLSRSVIIQTFYWPLYN